MSQVELAFEVERGRAGETALLVALLRDATGRAVDAPLQVRADCGVVNEPTRIERGIYAARIELPRVLGGRRTLLAVASAGASSGSAALPLGPGPAASVRVEVPADVAADGAARALWIGVADAHGNPSSEAPRAEARRGSLGDAVPLASGGWMIRYRPPRDTRAGEEVLRVLAGPAEASTTLRLAPMRPALSFGARAGVVFGTGGPAAAFAGEAAARLATRPLDLTLLLAATWWSTERRDALPASGGELALRSRQAWLPVTVAVGSRHALGARALATISMGAGGAFVTSRAELSGQPAVSELGWAPVATAGVELALRLRVGEPFAALQGVWIGDPHLDTLRGAARPILLLAGYRFHAL